MKLPGVTKLKFFLDKSKLLCFKDLEIRKETGKYCSDDISLPYSVHTKGPWFSVWYLLFRHIIDFLSRLGWYHQFDQRYDEIPIYKKNDRTLSTEKKKNALTDTSLSTFSAIVYSSQFSVKVLETFSDIGYSTVCRYTTTSYIAHSKYFYAMLVGYLLRKQRDAHINEYFFVTGRMCAKYNYINTYFSFFFFLHFNKIQAVYFFGCRIFDNWIFSVFS